MYRYFHPKPGAEKQAVKVQKLNPPETPNLRRSFGDIEIADKSQGKELIRRKAGWPFIVVRPHLVIHRKGPTAGNLLLQAQVGLQAPPHPLLATAKFSTPRSLFSAAARRVVCARCILPTLESVQLFGRRCSGPVNANRSSSRGNRLPIHLDVVAGETAMLGTNHSGPLNRQS